MELTEAIRTGELEPFAGEELRIEAGSRPRTPFLLLDPVKTLVRVGEGAEAQLAVLHEAPVECTLRIELARDARLDVAECFAGEAFAEVTLSQEAGSRCRLTTVQLASANARYAVDLDGAGAESELDALYLAADAEHCRYDVRVNHNASDCRSRSLVKGVASGEAVGEFRGLVYVAVDAQRTDARQTSRNIQLSPAARIFTRPQLEIYADDVKCSHGATVGQLDGEAVYYMRQRGLSERQARRLQIEGFAGDVLMRCPVEPFCRRMAAAAAGKLERI